MCRIRPTTRSSTSGDVTRDCVAKRAGEPVFHIGPERDLTIFTGLDAPFGPLETARYVICSGLYDDEVETPDDYRELIGKIRARNLFMVCANPDVVVERGRPAGLLRGRDRGPLCRAGRRGVLRRQAVPAALRSGAGGSHAREGQAGAPRSRVGDRGFGAHRI
jgi:hypothetical protein